MHSCYSRLARIALGRYPRFRCMVFTVAVIAMGNRSNANWARQFINEDRGASFARCAFSCMSTRSKQRAGRHWLRINYSHTDPARHGRTKAVNLRFSHRGQRSRHLESVRKGGTSERVGVLIFLSSIGRQS